MDRELLAPDYQQLVHILAIDEGTKSTFSLKIYFNKSSIYSMELPENRVHFFSGTPQQTGTSTLTITLTDANDNAPYFVENFNFRVGATTQEGEVVGMTFCQCITRFKR